MKAARRASIAARAALAAAALAVCAGLVALGNWQLRRLAWKHDLIERIAQRVQAAPAAAPGPAEWPQMDSAGRDHEYRRVRAAGVFLHDRETLVQAATRLGGGFWVLTPLRSADGAFTVLVNRGFVPPEQRDRATRASSEPAGETTVVGLLRLPEPGGTLLRRNDPADDRWYSRDVQAIAGARGLGSDVAPYFIDAEARQPAAPAGAATAAGPVGGLTVLAFADNHLAYALTWYALALMTAAAAGHALLAGRRSEGDRP